MIRYNYHTHTNFSDGKNSPEEVIQAAINLGFTSIGISDHAYTDFCTHWVTPRSRMDEYIEVLYQLKENYADKINVFVGIEQDAFSDPVSEKFEYAIGSVHWVKKGEKYIALDANRETLEHAIETYYDGDADALAEEYFALVASYAADPKISIVGHFDLITKFDEKGMPLFRPTPRYTAAWQAAARKLLDAGKIFEINTGAISRGHRTTPYPSEEILAFLGEHGASAILGSDSHSADTLDCAFLQAEELAKKYGILLVDLF